MPVEGEEEGEGEGEGGEGMGEDMRDFHSWEEEN